MDICSFDLNGKVAVVTGSSRGIGRAIATSLSAHGAKVVISSRTAESCEEVASDLNQRFGAGTAIVIPCDLGDKDSLQQLIKGTREQLGPIDILVCNAASNPYYGPMLEIPDDKFRRTLDNNILANHWLIQAAAPEMVERKTGSIIVVSSIGGLSASTVIGAYNVTKAADIQIVRNLAAELGPSGVRVNCIAPGLVRTDFARALWENPDTLKTLTDNAPLRRIGEPVEMAGAAVFLASDAASFLTGQTIIVDGGRTISNGT
jgi:NAD(P)-dependent dehydrogenase (short-subunit alcohol dehydrogenase family)